MQNKWIVIPVTSGIHLKNSLSYSIGSAKLWDKSKLPISLRSMKWAVDKKCGFVEKAVEFSGLLTVDQSGYFAFT
jgi:hypothetical protein